MKATQLTEVLRFWSYRTRLPEAGRLQIPIPWDGIEPRDLVGEAIKSRHNRTPRIDTPTIDIFLMWALQFGDIDCATADRTAAEYLAPGSLLDQSGTPQRATIEGWNCDAPLAEGRSQADSYLQYAFAGVTFKIGN